MNEQSSVVTLDPDLRQDDKRYFVWKINMSFVITAALMTYDIKQKYCHAVGNVTASQDKLRFSCQDLRAYFAGDKTLTLKGIDARTKIQMDYATTKNKITITGSRAHFENRRVVFTHNPHVVITSNG